MPRKASHQSLQGLFPFLPTDSSTGPAYTFGDGLDRSGHHAKQQNVSDESRGGFGYVDVWARTRCADTAGAELVALVSTLRLMLDPPTSTLQ